MNETIPTSVKDWIGVYEGQVRSNVTNHVRQELESDMKRLIHKDLSSLIRAAVIDEYNYRGVDSQIRQLKIELDVIRG